MSLAPNQEVTVKWNKRTRSHYESYGYIFTYTGDLLTIQVDHLSKGSDIPVKVICDYCEKEFTMTWKKYLYRVKLHKEGVHKVACKKCVKEKHKETCLVKYDTVSWKSTDDAKQKWKSYYTELYKENKESIDDSKNMKIKSQYGVDYSFQINKSRNLKFKDEVVFKILKLRYEHKLTSKEIAKEVNSNENTVRRAYNGMSYKSLYKKYFEDKSQQTLI